MYGRLMEDRRGKRAQQALKIKQAAHPGRTTWMFPGDWPEFNSLQRLVICSDEIPSYHIRPAFNCPPNDTMY